MILHLVYHIIYATKGVDRFHWAATPLKPYQVGNMCDRTFNLSLNQSFFHRKRQLCEKIPNFEDCKLSRRSAHKMRNGYVGNYKKWKSGIFANETTLHNRPNDTEINNYRSPYGLQQWAHIGIYRLFICNLS